MLIPTRENNWESYHSGVNPGQNTIVPAREISESLGLWINLPSWDMYDHQGKRATITIEWGEEWVNRHSFTYIRKDLLDKFLKQQNMALIWAIWGEREIYFSGKDLPRQQRDPDFAIGTP